VDSERKIEKRTEEEREALCRRCGICCHEKVRFGGQVVITDIPCDYLDLETNLCTIYPERLTKQPRCSSVEDSIKANSLPGDCPYVGGLSDYQTPHLLSDHPEYERAINVLFPGRKEGRLRTGKCGKSTS
jgi:uncharacterized cysteine cluster protein YcgN (CxxCxxCC family)